MTTHISRNYARALFDLAVESSLMDDIEQDLRAARDALWIDREVRAFLSNRLISRVTKKNLVRTGFEGKVDAQLVTFLFLLVDRGRVGLLGEICEEFERLCRLARGMRKVTVYSPFPLDSEEKTLITRSLEKRLSAHVALETEIRPSLIGGVVAESEGQEIELSIEGRLRDLEAHMGSIRTGHSEAGMEGK
jgi:F-type H+-transporting ATPase subunit delta